MLTAAMAAQPIVPIVASSNIRAMIAVVSLSNGVAGSAMNNAKISSATRVSTVVQARKERR